MKKRKKQAARSRPPRRTSRWKPSRLANSLEALLCAALLAGFLGGFYNFSRAYAGFRVWKLQIDGVRHLDEQTIAEASGITPRDPIFFFDAEAAARAVETLPYVKTCAVAIDFPDVIKLSVVERKEWASLLINSRAFAIDNEGIVLREYAADEMPLTPFITDVPGLEFVAPGQPVKNEEFREAMAVLKAFNANAASTEVTVSEVAAGSVDDIRMYCDELPYELRWGRGDYDEQARRLAVFWSEVGLARHLTEYLDLRFGRNIAAK
ncbi:MAG: FtsQ-type POTRA domain-containing protein [Candidatus Hydrogenedentota bacterium]